MAHGYDVIVLGAGAMGAAAAFHLASRGASVLVLEQFLRGHARGSSHGGSRVVRRAYFEHPDYVPLLRVAMDDWEDLQSRTGARLLHRCGVLYGGDPDGRVIRGSAESAGRHGIPFELLDADEAMRRWPQFRLPPGMAALWEPEAGFVRPEASVCAFLRLAEGHGAVVQEGERVESFEEAGRTIHLETDAQRYECERLVVAAGAWTGALCQVLGVPLRPTRQVMGWVEPEGPEAQSASHESRLPVWLLEDGPAGPLYGIPTADGQGEPGGVKVAHHLPGPMIDPDAGAAPPSPREREVLQRDVARMVPGIAGPVRHATTCIYTMSPDEHFVLDRLPGHRRTFVAAGFSGHGFKFAPVIGRALADLALEAETELPIGFLSWRRFGVSRAPDLA